MSKKLLIDARQTDETRVVLLNENVVEDVDYETSHRKQLKGNIYLAKVTRVEPSLQAAFVEYGGNRQGFLAFSEIHPDYYRIPVEDREKLLADQSDHSDKDTDPETKTETKTEIKTETKADSETVSDADADSLAANSDSDSDLETGADDNSSDDNDGDNDGDNGSDFEAEDERERKRRFDKFRKHYSIQEVISRRQILLVQVVKEERGNKGAALTTYMSLAGRYCVLMPNTYHNGGVSRKISDPADRKKLKTIVNGLNVPTGMAVIVRTAGSKRTKAEITRDYNYLLRQWNDIREKTLESNAPSIIHEEGNLIKRAVRDYYTSDIEEIIVEGEDGYKAARAHMKNLMPTHVKKITQYKDEVNHLFQAHRVENMLTAIYDPEVTLKSGGYIVMNQTEALVAIDVNSGKATRERNIEETALKTNVEAAVEIARQLKLRDLSGLVVIDFIDMEVNRNRNTVERKLKEAMKSDRARVQIGSISQFGLLEMSRQRLRPSLNEAVSDLCPHCHGTGRIRSVESAALAIIHQIEAEAARKSRKKLTVAMAAEVALYILNHKRDLIVDLEARYDMNIVLEQDNSLLPPDIRFDGISEKPEQQERRKSKGDSRSDSKSNARSDSNVEPKADKANNNQSNQTPTSPTDSDDDDESKPKRRRRRGKRGGRRRNRRDDENVETSVSENGDTGASDENNANTASDAEPSQAAGKHADTASSVTNPENTDKPAKPRRSRGRKPAQDKTDTGTSTDADQNTDASDSNTSDANTSDTAEVSKKPASRRKASPRTKAADANDADNTSTAPEAQADAEAEAKPAAKRGRRKKAEPANDANPDNNPDNNSDAKADAPAKPKRAPRKKKATTDNDTVDTKPAETPTPEAREQTSSADIQVVDVNSVSGESKKKGWWSR
ncbi:Rne/Rng family ribonuclease [Alphaproteobacteria bacterium]|nr:Rne/Rng family ribonuclease [Alphaproteobacteria bacterium]